MPRSLDQGMLETARSAVASAQKRGAREVAASVSRDREVSVDWRDGKLEKIAEATTRGLALELYVDGRYAQVSTSDLRPDAVERFIENAVAMTRLIEADPFRALPDPATYQGQAQVDLAIEDPAYTSVTSQRRRDMAQAIEAAARQVPGASSIISVTAGASDTQSDSVRVHSNGFEGGMRHTAFWMGAEVSVRDPSGRKPEEYHWVGSRFAGELPDLALVGRTAAERALGRIGARKGQSGSMKIAVDARVAGRLLRFFMMPLSGAALQQRQSFLEGRAGQKVASELLTITDDPLLPRGFASRLYDGEGMASRRRPVFDKGVLKSYFIDNYYARKLKMAVTTRGPSNLVFGLGSKGQAQLLADLKDGLFVTGFLGGNSNGTTGDFSLGVLGFMVRKGRLAEPVSEMNMSGNHLELWKRLVAVGNDPYPYGTALTPTLVFDGVQIAGT